MWCERRSRLQQLEQVHHVECLVTGEVARAHGTGDGLLVTRELGIRIPVVNNGVPFRRGEVPQQTQQVLGLRGESRFGRISVPFPPVVAHTLLLSAPTLPQR